MLLIPCLSDKDRFVPRVEHLNGAVMDQVLITITLPEISGVFFAQCVIRPQVFFEILQT